MTKKQVTVLVLVALLFSAGATLFFILRPNKASNNKSQQSTDTINFNSSVQGISFDYPLGLKQIPLSSDDLEDNFIFRADNSDPKSAPVLISVKYEDGLKVAAAVTKVNKLDLVLQNLRKNYPSRFPEFNEVSSQKIKIGEHIAQEIVFTYDSNNFASKQKLLVVDKNDDQVVYIAMQAKVQDFDMLNNQIFLAIIGSLKINSQ